MEPRKALAFALIVAIAISGLSLFAVKPANAQSMSLSLSDSAENSWVVKASMEVPRAFLGSAVVNGKIYAIGGDCGGYMGNVANAYGHTDDVVNATEEYDPITDTWVRKSSMPTARAGLATAVFQNKIYCIGGWKEDYLTTGVNEVYDPATDRWTAKTPMPIAIKQQVANVVNGKIYVLPLLSTSAFEVYDPQTDTWASKTPPPSEVKGFTSAVVGEKIYFETQIYDTSTDNWTVISTHPTQFDIYGSGGMTTGELAPSCIYFFMNNITNAYNISSNTWITGASMPPTNFTGLLFGPTETARYCSAAVVVNDTFYVIGGRSGVWGYFVDMKADNSNVQYFPIGYGAVQPSITILSPVNQEYNESSVPLTFTLDKAASPLQYSLDGQRNVTINENTTLTGLSNGEHNITIYAKYTMGSFGASEIVHFSVSSLDYLIVPVAGVGVASAVAIGVGLTYDLRKRR